MVVYLNDVTGEGGETRFIIPNITSGELPEMPMTVPQEMDYYGQHGGVETISIKPMRGRCLLFTHDWLHESLPLQEGSKFILRTDIVATSPETPVFMSRKEIIDYQQTLELFNAAEQMELGASAYRQEKRSKTVIMHSLTLIIGAMKMNCDFVTSIVKSTTASPCICDTGIPAHWAERMPTV